MRDSKARERLDKIEGNLGRPHDWDVALDLKLVRIAPTGLLKRIEDLEDYLGIEYKGKEDLVDYPKYVKIKTGKRKTRQFPK